MTGKLQTYERRQFCPTCGARLFFLFDDGVEVFLGARLGPSERRLLGDRVHSKVRSERSNLGTA